MRTISLLHSDRSFIERLLLAEFTSQSLLYLCISLCLNLCLSLSIGLSGVSLTYAQTPRLHVNPANPVKAPVADEGRASAESQYVTYIFKVKALQVSSWKEDGSGWDALGNRPDLSVRISVAHREVLRTSVRKNQTSAQWPDELSDPVSFYKKRSKAIRVMIIDKDLRDDDLIGEFLFTLSPEELEENPTINLNNQNRVYLLTLEGTRLATLGASPSSISSPTKTQIKTLGQRGSKRAQIHTTQLPEVSSSSIEEAQRAPAPAPSVARTATPETSASLSLPQQTQSISAHMSRLFHSANAPLSVGISYETRAKERALDWGYSGPFWGGVLDILSRSQTSLTFFMNTVNVRGIPYISADHNGGLLAILSPAQFGEANQFELVIITHPHLRASEIKLKSITLAGEAINSTVDYSKLKDFNGLIGRKWSLKLDPTEGSLALEVEIDIVRSSTVISLPLREGAKQTFEGGEITLTHYATTQAKEEQRPQLNPKFTYTPHAPLGYSITDPLLELNSASAWNDSLSLMYTGTPQAGTAMLFSFPTAVERVKVSLTLRDLSKIVAPAPQEK